jgi:hypothetical protein
LLLDRLNENAQFFDFINGNGLEFSSINKTCILAAGSSNVINADYGATGNLYIGKNEAQIWCETSNQIVRLGDANGNNNITQINIDDTINQIQLRANTGGNIILDYDGLILNGPTQPTANAPADYLQVNVNGTNYVIQLLNP